MLHPPSLGLAGRSNSAFSAAQLLELPHPIPILTDIISSISSNGPAVFHMEVTEPVNIPAQLQTLSRYVHEELDAAAERADARRKIGEFFHDLIEDEGTRKTTLEDSQAREQIMALLNKYEGIEQSELERFTAKFQIIEQMLTMMSTLVHQGRDGIDFTLTRDSQ